MKHLLLALILLTVAAVPQLHAADQAKPRIRAITGFVTIDATSYASQLEEAVTFLNQVRDAVKAAGYDVSGIRISTQPFPDYTRSLSHADALALLRGIAELAVKLRFNPNIGPAMVTDADDSASIDLLTEILRSPATASTPTSSSPETMGSTGTRCGRRRGSSRAWASGARTGRATSTSPPSRC